MMNYYLVNEKKKNENGAKEQKLREVIPRQQLKNKNTTTELLTILLTSSIQFVSQLTNRIPPDKHAIQLPI